MVRFFENVLSRILYMIKLKIYVNFIIKIAAFL